MAQGCSRNTDILFLIVLKCFLGDTKSNISFSKGKTSGDGYSNSGYTRSSTNHELLHVLREQATWRPGQVDYAQGMSYSEIIASFSIQEFVPFTVVCSFCGLQFFGE